MLRSVILRAEPNVRQTQRIIERVEWELTSLGATTKHDGPGRLVFRLPPPWRAPRLGRLLAITSGAVAVSAGAGGPRRVRYRLSFFMLRVIIAVFSVVLVVVGWRWHRTSLLNGILLLWTLAYGIPYLLAAVRFRKLVESAAREVVERRRRARDETDPGGAPPPGGGAPVARGI